MFVCDMGVSQLHVCACECLQCSAHCGAGITTRSVVCAQKTAAGGLLTLADELCDAQQKPANQQACHEADCDGVWFTGPWGKVSL